MITEFRLTTHFNQPLSRQVRERVQENLKKSLLQQLQTMHDEKHTHFDLTRFKKQAVQAEPRLASLDAKVLWYVGHDDWQLHDISASVQFPQRFNPFMVFSTPLLWGEEPVVLRNDMGRLKPMTTASIEECSFTCLPPILGRVDPEGNTLHLNENIVRHPCAGELEIGVHCDEPDILVPGQHMHPENCFVTFPQD